MDLARFITTDVVREDDLRNFSKLGAELGNILCDRSVNTEE